MIDQYNDSTFLKNLAPNSFSFPMNNSTTKIFIQSNIYFHNLIETPNDINNTINM